jgi:aspartate aminotransferase
MKQRMDGIQESVTLRLNSVAKALAQEGRSIVNLTAGEPDFTPPPECEAAVNQAVARHDSKYTPTAGHMALRASIAAFTNQLQPALSAAAPWTALNVVVTNGGKQSIFNAILSLLRDGDEVLIPSPFWLSYPEMVKISGGVPVIVPTSIETEFLLTPQQLKSKITPKTKLLILNSPSNPSGASYSRKQMEALGAVLEEHPGVWIISDEIYLAIQYGDNPSPSFLDACPSLSGRTITSSGLSKSCSVTGWRIGWAVGPQAFLERMIALQAHSTSGISSLSQAAAIAAFDVSPKIFESQRQIFEARRARGLEMLRSSAKLKVFEPKGAFYLWVGVQDALQEGEDADTFSERCLKEAGLAVVPGTAFGMPEYIRLSFACDMETLEEGCRRLLRLVDPSSTRSM